MFKLYDVVKLKKDRLDLGIKKNFTGTIVDICNDGKAFTVEFFDENDETIDKSLYVYFEESDLILVEPFNDFIPANLELASGK